MAFISLVKYNYFTFETMDGRTSCNYKTIHVLVLLKVILNQVCLVSSKVDLTVSTAMVLFFIIGVSDFNM